MNYYHEKKTVLVVDDNPGNIHVLKRVLQAEYEVRAALSGAEALQLVLKDPQPDIILLDILMPVMDGYEVCLALKSSHVTEKIPVIFVTAETQVDQEERGLAAGAVDYIIKPFSAPIIEARIRTHIALYDKKRELEVSNLQLLRAKAAAEEAYQSKSSFLASMSHEIRTPLTSILGFAELIQLEAKLSEEHAGWMSSLKKSGNHLLDLINNILDISRIEAGRGSHSIVTFDLTVLLNEMETMFKVLTDQKGLQLEFLTVGTLPDAITADKSKLNQILINLIGNAVKFTDRGYITSRVSIEEVENRLSLTIDVQDTGSGIAVDELDKVFATFDQTESGRRARMGTGLGLAISRKYARFMGGDITFTSELGVGSNFCVTVLVDRAERIDEKTSPQIIKLLSRQGEIKILLVDENDENLLYLSRLLSGTGFSVVTARNGRQGMELFKLEQPDLIIMSRRMQVIDGLECMQQIKSTTQGEKTPVICLSASVFAEEKQKILNQGWDDFLLKPFNRNGLLELLGSHLNLDYEYADRGVNCGN